MQYVLTFANLNLQRYQFHKVSFLNKLTFANTQQKQRKQITNQQANNKFARPDDMNGSTFHRLHIFKAAFDANNYFQMLSTNDVNMLHAQSSSSKIVRASGLLRSPRLPPPPPLGPGQKIILNADDIFEI